MFALRTTPVTRGAAYWVRAGTLFNRYYGPFEVSLSDATGVKFGTTAGQQSLRLRNITTTNGALLFKPGSQPPPLQKRGNDWSWNMTFELAKGEGD